MVITTAEDVVDFTHSNKHLNALQLCPFIDVEEETIFNTTNCLGWDYYVYLQSNLFLPTISPVIFEDYTIYLVGEYVSYEGRIYECVATTTGMQNPTNSNNFARIKKFISQASNDIWIRYLGKLISWTVLVRATDAAAVLYTENGIVRPMGDTFKPATPQEIEIMKRNLVTARKELVENLEKFLERNKDLYPQTNFYKEKCCKKDCNPFNSKGRYTNFGFNI